MIETPVIVGHEDGIEGRPRRWIQFRKYRKVFPV